MILIRYSVSMPDAWPDRAFICPTAWIGHLHRVEHLKENKEEGPEEDACHCMDGNRAYDSTDSSGLIFSVCVYGERRETVLLGSV